MNRTIIITLGLLAALLTAAGMMELGQQHHPIAVARRQLHDKKYWIREEALLTFVMHNDRASIPAIIRLLEHDDLNTRVDAIGALGRLKAKEAIPKITILLQDPEFRIRRLAVWALGRLGVKEAIPEITKLLQDNDYHVRETAVQALMKLNAKEAIPEIIKLLQDDEMYVIDAALEAVVMFRSNEAIPEIKKLLSDKEKVYSISAKWVLEQLGVPDKEIEDAKQK